MFLGHGHSKGLQNKLSFISFKVRAVFFCIDSTLGREWEGFLRDAGLGWQVWVEEKRQAGGETALVGGAAVRPRPLCAL